ncbi:MAG: NADH-quinone oxidoreductase subunit K [Coriobacteriia bacterium]|nr:NADH-quinone oxidoreductase subunit K [Coriobacteriia bacterium]
MPLALACSLFSLGLYAVLTRRDLVGVLVGVEVMVGAAAVLVASLGAASGASSGAVQAVGLLVLVLGAGEAAVGLSLLLALDRGSGRTRVDELDEVSG